MAKPPWLLKPACSRDDVTEALVHLENDARLVSASFIGITIYPAYPLGYFRNSQLTVPDTYQNGGD